MNLSPVEAINRINESVTVEMHVQSTKCCTGSRQVFLDSEANHRDPKNLGVVVTESGRDKFSEAGIAKEVDPLLGELPWWEYVPWAYDLDGVHYGLHESLNELEELLVN